MTIIMTFAWTFYTHDFVENILLTKYKISTLFTTMAYLVTFVTSILIFIWTILLRMRFVTACKTFKDICAILSLMRLKTYNTYLFITVVFRMTGFFTFQANFLWRIVVVTILWGLFLSFLGLCFFYWTWLVIENVF